MPGKTMLCPCEDVTLKDVRHAMEAGYTDLEEVKRYTGFGTGPCQGKECMALIAGTLAKLGGSSETVPFTSRPPLVPTELKFFAAEDEIVAPLPPGHVPSAAGR